MCFFDGDPTEWLGIANTAVGRVVVSVPPAGGDNLVITLTDASTTDGRDNVGAFVAISASGTQDVIDALTRALASLDEPLLTTATL